MAEECAEVIIRVNHPRLGHFFHYRIPEGMEKPVPGTRVTVPFGARVAEGWIIGYSAPEPGITLRDIIDFDRGEPDFTEEILKLANWMAGYYLHPVGQILDSISPPRKPKKPLPIFSSPSAAPQLRLPKFILTAEQQRALEEIKEAIGKREYSRFLLYGVTGSGKTEVYLRATEAALNADHQVLYLLPEIALTPQMNHIFQERFGEKVGVWHHRIAGREKYRVWEGIRSGKLRVLIGPRSAVFAPFRQLGLIIIDEEHDPAYKQQNKPYHHARQIALWRAQYNRAVIVLGSATPSLESYASAAWGRTKILSMKKRPAGRCLPVINLVDLRQEGGEPSYLSEYLVEQIKLRLERKEQVILFLNRRGYAPMIYCPVCGEVIKCNNCSISLIYHKQTRDLRCHYCNVIKRVPASCPSCGSTKKLSFLGVGIQRVEKELIDLLPGGRVARLDFDTTRRKGDFQRILGSFARKEADILLGTQMVAKGHDFPDVTLVGVLNADLSLNLPDFRSAEHTFQLLTQVSGRAGRGEKPGEVIVQTLNPNHYSIESACRGEDKLFYREEAYRRRSLGYPPFGELIRVRFSGKDEEKVMNNAAQFAQHIKQTVGTDHIVVLGPAPAPVLRVKGQYRYQVMLKGNCRKVRSEIESCLVVYRKNKSVIINVEIDPYGF
ncbi:MAG: primosomal protein N' [Syntrophaceticus sp.]|jgi:primosomal protein N' (replication factor Y)|nr:primosomal protein N' [Syntrophaceticus sp.]MDD3314858.1 primosomal protein N' [Syntrophaceticus sp.]MDD4360104.1 primosomal protein N' [Syntrophaceticus sp.]MDD4783010.1 primosomal protein N' [Syntrophaceticus sp.]